VVGAEEWFASHIYSWLKKARMRKFIVTISNRELVALDQNLDDRVRNTTEGARKPPGR